MSPLTLCLLGCKAKRCQYNEFAVSGKKQRRCHERAIVKSYPAKTQSNHWTIAACDDHAELRRNFAKIRRNYATSKCYCSHPYPLKNEIWGGGVVLKCHFKIPSFAFIFLNDQHSSSFHIIGKQMKIKYLRLPPEEISTCQTEAAHV